jgi:hypothetical protein
LDLLKDAVLNVIVVFGDDGDGEAGVDEDIVAGFDVGDEGNSDLYAVAADVDEGFFVVDFEDFGSNS